MNSCLNSTPPHPPLGKTNFPPSYEALMTMTPDLCCLGEEVNGLVVVLLQVLQRCHRTEALWEELIGTVEGVGQH